MRRTSPEFPPSASLRRPVLGTALASALLASGALTAWNPATAQPRPPSQDAAPAAPGTPTEAPAEPADRGRSASGQPVRPYTIQPGIAARYSWSDNIDLRGRGREVSGSILEVAPFVRADLATARGYGSLNYAVRGLKYFGSELYDRDIRHDLRAVADVDLAGDALRLAAVAQRFDISRSAFGVGSFDPAARGTDRTTYTRLDLSPYSIGRLTGSTDYELRYRLSYVDPGADYASNVVNGVSGELGSVIGQSRTGWLVRGDAFVSSYDSGFDYRNTLVEVLGTYAPVPTLRLAAGVNHASNDQLANADGNRSGVGPSLGLQWTPNLQSQFAARWSQTYYGDFARVQATYVVGRLRLGAAYDRGIRDGNQASVLYYDPLRLFVGASGRPLGSSVIPVPGALEVGGGAGAPLVSGGVQSPIVDSDSLIGTLDYAGARSGVVFTVYASGQRPALVVPGFAGVQPLEQRGVFARYAYRLDTINTISTDLRVQESETIGSDARSTLTSVGLELRTRLSRQAIGSIGVRANRQRGSAGTPEYDERGVGGGLEYRF